MDNTEKINENIEDIIKECNIHRFSSELQKTKDEERKISLREILQTFEKEIPQVCTKTKLDIICDNIEKHKYNKSWGKLNVACKKNRLKEFIVRTQKNEKKHEKYTKRLTDMLDGGKLKQTYITYDEYEGFISSIDIPKK
jgi:hypothetical protein